MTAAQSTPAQVHLVELTDEEGHSQNVRAFPTFEAAQAYAAQWDDVPDTYAQAFTVDVTPTVPRVIRYMQVTFGLTMYRRGLRWWDGDLTEDSIGITIVHHLDEDSFGPQWKNEPVTVTRTDSSGDIHLMVEGTDEAQIRAAYVAGVREILAAAGE